jgi:hypothetical protein
MHSASFPRALLNPRVASIFACDASNTGDLSVMKKLLVLAVMAPLFLCVRSHAAQASEAILLTIFLKHDQSLNLAEIQKLQEDQGFWKAFPLKAPPW